MNVHHLELFYYVARHGGIMEAVRNIPYGIQQPAVSGQMAQLEERLGVTLFQRRPFQLTAKGEKLYQFIAPFFSNLEKMAGELQGGQPRLIRIGASAIVLRDHLPAVFQAARKKLPGLKLSLCEGFGAQLEGLLLHDEIDLALTTIEKRPANGVRFLPLVEVRPCLLTRKESAVKSAAELWKRDKIEDALICLPAAEPMCRNFQKKLSKLGREWFPAIEASSIDLIEAYVAAGFGVGLSILIPGKPPPPALRELPLDDFEPVVVGALWRGRKTPLLEIFIDEARKRAGQLG